MTIVMVDDALTIGEDITSNNATLVTLKVDSLSKHSLHGSFNLSELLKAIGDDPHNKLSVNIFYGSRLEIWFDCEALAVSLWPDWGAQPTRMTFTVNNVTVKCAKRGSTYTYPALTEIKLPLDNPTNLTFETDLVAWLSKADEEEAEELPEDGCESAVDISVEATTRKVID